MNIVEFCRARIEQDKAIAIAERDQPKSRQQKNKPSARHYALQTPKKVLRQSDFMLAIIQGIESELGTNLDDSEMIDNVGLYPILLMATIWAEHRDYDMYGWFPSLKEENSSI